MSETFTGHGWRHKEQPGCFAFHQDRPVPQVRTWVDTKGHEHIAFVRCERPKGHKGWHSCDNLSWPP